MLTGPAAEWLRSRREELNAGFLLMRRRYPALSASRVTSLLATLLPPLAGGEASHGLLQAVYELVLLHAGRDTFGSQPGLMLLLQESFVALKAVLQQDSARLPASLSNALEQMGERGVPFARGLVTLAPHVRTPEILRDAAAVLAWRLGHARLRGAAMERLNALPAGALLAALGLTDWPETTAALAVAALESDGWQPPGERISRATLERIADRPEKIAALSQTLHGAPLPPLDRWRPLARLGDFSGFGGAFDQPPVLLTGSEAHAFRLQCGPEAFRLEADLFGAVATRVIALRPNASPGAIPSVAGTLDTSGLLSTPWGTLRHPALAGASSSLLLGSTVVFTRSDSHRVRIFGPWREPL